MTRKIIRFPLIRFACLYIYMWKARSIIKHQSMPCTFNFWILRSSYSLRFDSKQRFYIFVLAFYDFASLTHFFAVMTFFCLFFIKFLRQPLRISSVHRLIWNFRGDEEGGKSEAELRMEVSWVLLKLTNWDISTSSRNNHVQSAF